MELFREGTLTGTTRATRWLAKFMEIFPPNFSGEIPARFFGEMFYTNIVEDGDGYATVDLFCGNGGNIFWRDFRRLCGDTEKLVTSKFDYSVH